MTSKFQSNMHSTSQTHKTKLKNYKINPFTIPRPNSFNEVFSNENHLPIFSTTIESVPPFTDSYYKVKEENNTSPRFIRSTMVKVPTLQKVLINSHLNFGIYFQPFTQIPSFEKDIFKKDISESNKEIIRCNKCKAYINNKWELGNMYLKCNLCENNISLDNNEIDENYIKAPTVDYKIKKTEFIPHYIFYIDISYEAYNNGFSSYILNSILLNLDYFHNKEQTHICIVLFNNYSMFYIIFDQNGEYKIIIMSDIEDPFCPLDIKKCFILLNENLKIGIEKLINNLEKFIVIKSNNSYKKIQCQKALLNCIISGIDSLKTNGGRNMIFFYNKSNEIFNIEEKEKQTLKNIINTCIEEHIVIDLFVYDIIENSKFLKEDIKYFSQYCFNSGGKFLYYPVNNPFSKNLFSQIELNFNLEKIYYDLLSIISVNNYYDCRFMLRHSSQIDCYEILGGFLNKLGLGIQFGGCSNDTSFTYLFRLNEELKIKILNFQIAGLYIDNFGDQYLRLYNYSIGTTNKVSDLFITLDIDVITKLTLMKEINNNLIINMDFISKNKTKLETENTIDYNIKKENLSLYKRILDSFLFYRNEGSDDKDPSRLILPSTLKYFPLFINSYIKQKNLYFQFQILSLPVYSIIKMLYPKLYRIDDIQNDQSYCAQNVKDKDLIIHNIGYLNEKLNIIQKPYMLRLSKDSLDWDSAYIIDDGQFINMYIFNYIEFDFYKKVFSVDNWEECIKNFIMNLDENEDVDNQDDLKKRIRNIIQQLQNENYEHIQPVKIYFLNENNWKTDKNIILKYLIEDDINGYDSYVDYLCKIHSDIQREMD